MYRFPRKGDLVQGVFDHFASRARDELVRTRDAAGAKISSEDRLALVAALAKDHRRTRVLLSLVLASPPDPELADRTSMFVHAQRKGFAALVGRPEGDLDAEIALAALRGIAVEQMLLDGKDQRIDARVQRILMWLASPPRDR